MLKLCWHKWARQKQWRGHCVMDGYQCLKCGKRKIKITKHPFYHDGLPASDKIFYGEDVKAWLAGEDRATAYYTRLPSPPSNRVGGGEQ